MRLFVCTFLYTSYICLYVSSTVAHAPSHIHVCRRRPLGLHPSSLSLSLSLTRPLGVYIAALSFSLSTIPLVLHGGAATGAAVDPGRGAAVGPRRGLPHRLHPGVCTRGRGEGEKAIERSSGEAKVAQRRGGADSGPCRVPSRVFSLHPRLWSPSESMVCIQVYDRRRTVARAEYQQGAHIRPPGIMYGHLPGLERSGGGSDVYQTGM
jgi:hypothetical protein